MKFQKLIESRRSIRAYDPERMMALEQLNIIVNAATQDSS